MSIASGTLTVSHTGDELDLDLIQKSIAATGHRVIVKYQQDPNAILGFFRFLLSGRNTTLTSIAALLTLTGLLFTILQWRAEAIALFSAAILIGGFPITSLAYRELFRSRSLGI